ncbi:MAG: ATP synthase F1 subunit epsilon [Actinobacteria bacterium]|nr:ATP synthase F1 subunit epsilon [Actinomycetota bacterium]
MAKTPFRAEVLTPEGACFDDEVVQISTRTTTGSIGILARHQPLLGMLEPTELRLYRGESESDFVTYAQGEGYVQVSPDGVLLLVEEAHSPDSLDLGDLRDKLKRAEDALSSAEEGSEERRRASRDKRRWEAFIGIAEGGAAARGGS